MYPNVICTEFLNLLCPCRNIRNAGGGFRGLRKGIRVHHILGICFVAFLVIIPNGSTVIQPGDRVMIFALTSAIKEVEKSLMVKLEYW
jgi:hypothetical protein